MADFERAREESVAPTTQTAETVEPADNQAATAQSAELTGQAPEQDPQAAQADEAREAERVAAARKGWEALLGEKLGGKAFDLIREHVSFTDLTGYAKQGTAALADLAKAPFSEGKTFSAKDAEALNALAAAFAPELQKLADKWLEGESGQRVFTAISEWIEESPGAVTAIAASLGALAIGAAVVAILQDADPPAIEKMFEVAKGLKIGGKLDLASIKNFAVESAELSMSYSAGGFSARLGGSTKQTADGQQMAATAGVGYKGKGFETSANASWDEKNGLTGDASVSGGIKREGFEASADAKWDSEKGVSAGAKIAGQGGTDKFKGDYLADIRVDEEGRTQVMFKGGIGTVINDLPAELRAGLTHATGGGKDDATKIEASMKLGEAGNEQTVTGTLDPQTGAFTLTFDRKAYDGALTLQQGLQGDGKGGVQTTQSLDYKIGDDLHLTAGEKTGPQGTQRNVGLDFTTGSFKNSFDLEMKDAVTRMNLGTQATLGDFSVKGNAGLNLDDGRLEQLGLSLGWRDPNAFKSATLQYKLQWQQDNAEYAHHFEAAFEHSIGKWDGRVTGNLDLQGGDLKSAGIDGLAGYRIADRWRVLGGASVASSNAGGQQSTSAGVRAGIQFDNVAVTFGVEKTFGGGTQTGFRLEIPLGR
ncbi:MAG: hypothetical protein R3F60_27200 [bacterium]